MSGARATTAQRDHVRRLLRKSGQYDARTVTLMHRRLGVADNWIGRPADEWMDSLAVADADALIKKLQAETSHGT
jgi:hypothetical protein